MVEEHFLRRMAAILVADVVGYSRLMGEDEEGTLSALKKFRSIADPIIAARQGRVFGSAGDSVIAEFASPVESTRCAVEIQNSMKSFNSELPDEKRLLIRIGVNFGDIVVDGHNLMGDAVNIAARLEGLADPGGVCLSRAVVDHVVDKLDIQIDYLGELSVKNISRPIAAYSVVQSAAGLEHTEKGGVSRKPAIVVLPFKNVSQDPEQTFFAEGIAEDIITNLSRFEELVVIAQQSAFTFNETNTDAIEFARKLGVAYALEGSVRRSSDRVRVSVRLIDASSRATLWADRFDREITDIFAVQDEISGAVVNALVGEVSERHLEQLRAQPLRRMDAYDHALRSQRAIWAVSREDIAQARAEAEAALELEPDFARAHVLLAWAALTEDGNGWGESSTAQYDKSVAHARIAVGLDNKNPWAHAMLAISTFWRDQEVSESLSQLKYAVELNPSNAHIRMLLGAQLAYMGEGEQAIEQLNFAVTLNPLFPDLYLVHRSRAYFVIDRNKEALADAIRASTALPKHPTALAMLAVCRAALGHMEEAQSAAQRILDASPGFCISFARKSYPYIEPEMKERFLKLLTASGLPN